MAPSSLVRVGICLRSGYRRIVPDWNITGPDGPEPAGKRCKVLDPDQTEMGILDRKTKLLLKRREILRSSRSIPFEHEKPSAQITGEGNQAEAKRHLRRKMDKN
ncbi:predicted protein [Coccidioides posadasii str. Silveira]|uniref:Predicted protein n=1 Tax=Coccidioides posadasii (strain RMSCC 757 / Silveira) TaxID=443226 RepID=E9DHG1_COCPS|nr:predicted protein [Coccidioides posadasii str. Silveira]